MKETLIVLGCFFLILYIKFLVTPTDVGNIVTCYNINGDRLNDATVLYDGNNRYVLSGGRYILFKSDMSDRCGLGGFNCKMLEIDGGTFIGETVVRKVDCKKSLSDRERRNEMTQSYLR